MAYRTLKGEAFTWHHTVRATAADFDFFASTFGMSPRDVALLDRDAALPHLYNYGSWHMVRCHIPDIASTRNISEALTFTLIFNKHTLATITEGHIASLESIFAEAKRTRKVPQLLRSGAVGDVVTWLLTEVFDALDIAIDAVSHRVEKLEGSLRKVAPDVVTRDLGRLRRDTHILDLMAEPSRVVLEQLMQIREPYRSPRVTAALRVCEERLRAMHVVLDHNGRIVDTLFREHEAVLSHRTNRIIQVLTLISVLLMPPTLVASYYGMNVAGLPFAHDVRIVSIIVVGVIVVFFVFIVRLLRR